MVSSLVRAQFTYHNTNFKNTLYTTPLSNNLFTSLVLKAQLLQSVPTSSQQIMQAKAGCLVLIFIALIYPAILWLLQLWGFQPRRHPIIMDQNFIMHFSECLQKNLVTQLVFNTVAYQISEMAIVIMLYLCKGTDGIGPLVKFRREEEKWGLLKEKKIF